MHPNLAQAYRQKVEQLQEALAKPEDREATLMLRRLIERVVVRPAGEGLKIKLIGEIVWLAELSLDGNGPRCRRGRRVRSRWLRGLAPTFAEHSWLGLGRTDEPS